LGGRLVRINPRDARVPVGEVALEMGAVEGLGRIDATVGSLPISGPWE
jgi:hypothetical protein